MDEQEALLNTLDAYIKRLEEIKKNPEKEIKESYFSLMCMGSDIECSALHLLRKYQRPKYDETLEDKHSSSPN